MISKLPIKYRLHTTKKNILEEIGLIKIIWSIFVGLLMDQICINMLCNVMI